MSFCSGLFLALTLVLIVNGFIVNPGPKVIATRGHPWPLPKKWQSTEAVYSVDHKNFKIELIGGFGCAILNNATERYSRIIADMGYSLSPTKSELENSVLYHVRK